MNKGTAHCTVFWKQCARGICVSGVREASPPSSGPHCTGWTRNGRSRTDSDAQAGLSRELAVSVGCADPGCRKSRCNRGVLMVFVCIWMGLLLDPWVIFKDWCMTGSLESGKMVLQVLHSRGRGVGAQSPQRF